MKKTTSRKRIPFAIAPITAAIVCVLAAILLTRHWPGWDQLKAPQDFTVYLKARDQLIAGVSPYNPELKLTYKYAPSRLLLLELLPNHHGWAWWTTKLLYVVSWAGALLFGARIRDPKHLGLLMLGVILSWKGLLEALDYGQLEFFLLFVGVMASRFWRERPEVSGAWIGFLPGWKSPWLLMAAPFLIMGWMTERPKKRWLRFGLGFVASLVAWELLLPVLVWGPTRYWQLLSEWLYVLKTQPTQLFLDDFNQSVWIALQRWFGTGAAPWVSVIAAALMGWLGWKLIRASLEKRDPADALAWVSPWFLYAQLVSPLAWRWGALLWVGLPLAWEAHSGWKRSRLALVMVVGGSWLIQQNPVIHALGFKHWTDLHIYSTLTIQWLAMLVLSL